MGRRRAGGHSARPERAASEQKEQKKKRSPKKENLNYGKSIGKENITRPGAREERVVEPVPQKGGNQQG